MAKIAIGDYFRALIEHKQAFGKKANNYINLSFVTENLPLNFYTNDQKESLYNFKFSQFDLNFSKSYGTDWSTSAGINFQMTKFSPEVADNAKVKGNMNVFYTYLKSEARTTDRRIFPTHGFEFTAEAGMVFHRKASIIAYDTDGNTADISYVVNNNPAFYKVMLNFSDYHSLNSKLVFNYMLQSDICIKSQGFLFDDFYLGGVQQVFKQQKIFVGINEGQIISGSFFSALVGLQYNFYKEFFLLGKANTAIYDFSTPTEIYDKKKVKYLNGFSLGLGYNLGFLPMEFTAMYSPEIGTLYKHIKIGFIF